MKIAWISDFDLRGSGYLNISAPLCQGLHERGHEIKAIGLGYIGNEHPWDFTLIPAKTLQEVAGVLQHLSALWNIDVLVVALDIPLQEKFLQSLTNRKFKYVGIMPLESDPLCVSWAMVLMQMDAQLIISAFGTNEVKKLGIPAEHLRIGVDTAVWARASESDRTKLREAQGIEEDEFIVLTVAANQERKHLSRAMEIFADFLYGQSNITLEKIKQNKLSPKIKARQIFVTQEFTPMGWKLADYAQSLGISNHFHIIEKGLSHKMLWATYALSDALLLPSKAEGLGLPILEAMAVGIPVTGTDCTAIRELIADGRGLPIPPDYEYTDPFGNGKRYFASRSKGVRNLNKLRNNKTLRKSLVNTAYKWVSNRNWKHPLDTLEQTLLSVV